MEEPNIMELFGLRKTKQSRTVDSVADDLMQVICESVSIAGTGDAHQMLIKLTRHAIVDNEFRNLLNGLAAKVLEIFPA